MGFPGETDPQFNELLGFLRDMQLDAVGAFTFFPEAGTPAASLPDQIPDSIKQARLDELMRTQQGIAFGRNEARVGSELMCLIDSTAEDDTAVGRFYGQARRLTVCAWLRIVLSNLGSLSKAVLRGQKVMICVLNGFDVEDDLMHR